MSEKQRNDSPYRSRDEEFADRAEIRELSIAVLHLADYVDRMEMTSYLGGWYYTTWFDNLQKLVGMRTQLEELQAKVAHADFVKRQSLVPYRLAS